MEDTRQLFECEGCGAEYSLQTDMDMKAEFCPFCSEPLEEIDWEYDDENTKQEGEGSQITAAVYATSHREVRY